MQRSTDKRQVEPGIAFNSASSYHFLWGGMTCSFTFSNVSHVSAMKRKNNSVHTGYRTTCLSFFKVLQVGSIFLYESKWFLKNCHKDDLILKSVAAANVLCFISGMHRCFSDDL
jgi:hypothetical protein